MLTAFFKMKIYLASDHAGYWLKEELKENIHSLGHEIEDVGNTQYDPNDDYPDFIFPLAKKVSQEPNSFGIIIGRTGNGEAMAANKVIGVRAALCLNEEMARYAREDNDANVLALGSEFVSSHEAEKVVNVFLDTPFPGEERHTRRIEKIKTHECQT